MTPSSRVAHPGETSSTSQPRRTAANAAAHSPTSKRTPRATRTSNRTTALETNGVENIEDIEDRATPNISRKKKKTESVPEEEVPPPLSGETAANKTRQRGEVKQGTEEDTQEQEPSVAGSSTSIKRKSRVKEAQKPANLQVDAGTPRTVKRKRTLKVEEPEIEVSEPSPKKTKRTKATEAAIEETVKDETSPNKAKRKTKVKEEDEEVQEGEGGQQKIKRKRKTKEEKELEAMPLAVRTDGLRMFIGAHVSGAKGWSYSMYIAPVELRLVFESRGSQFSHQLRAHWVNNLHIFIKVS